MCGRFAQTKLDWPSYLEAFGDIAPPDLPASFNIKPTQDIAMAYMQDGEMIAAPARWWFVPHWHRGGIKDWKAATFNAKIETAHEKPTFRTAWKNNRCVIPATGYYEWTGPKGDKQPHYISVEQNAPVFFFAGLYSTLRDGTQTATVMTTKAAPDIKELHHRMPLILSTDQVTDWLTCDGRDYGWGQRHYHYMVNPFGVNDEGEGLIDPIV